MATGLPVVATDVGGTPELVVPRETGTLVAPSDPVGLAAVIGAYLGEAERMSRHGVAGRRRVESRFSLPAMVDGYLAVYDGILESKRCAHSPVS
jgi:glycosyltransferase involved in cell wall biosynthesis